MGDRTREFACSFRVNYERDDTADADLVNWSKIFKNNETVKLEASAYYWTDKGQEVYHKITIEEFQLTEQPSKPVNNRGDIEISLTGRAIVENASNIITWEVIDEDGWINSQDDATLAVTFSNDSPSAGDEVIATITGDRRITGLAIDDLSVTTGSTLGTELTKVSDTVYTIPVTTSATAGNVVLTVAADAVGQGNAEATGTVTTT